MIARPVGVVHHLRMTDTSCTAEDRQAVVSAAEVRRQYMLWLARRLRESDEQTYRTAMADEVDQLFRPERLSA